MLSELLYIVSGFLLGLAFQGGLFLFLIPFALVGVILARLNSPSLPDSDTKATVPILRANRQTDAVEVGRILRPAMTQTGIVLAAKDTFTAFPGEGEAAFDKLKDNEIWQKLESDLDPVYLGVLRSLEKLIPKAHSVLFFLKSGDGRAFRIRQFASLSEDSVNRSVLIPDGSGVVGQLAGRDLLRILEGDLPSGKSLGYYVGIPPVHSVAGVPLFNGKKERVGALVVDSEERSAFGADIIPVLENFAAMFYMLTYKSFASASNFREKKKFYELAAYQQKFFKTTLLRDTYKEIFDYVSRNFQADRIMILVFDLPDKAAQSHNSSEKELGTVAFCRGEDESSFEGMHFSLSDKGILPLSMMQHTATERVFSGRVSDYVPRLNDGEVRNHSLRYLFVQPSSMTMRNAALNEPSELAICLERRYPEKLGQLEKDLLRFVVNIAYFAYQRGKQFEHEQFAIYHDELTGLLNRRTIDEEVAKLNQVHQVKNVGVMMMDIDHFKKFNDTYGHAAGDIVLKEVAARISSVAERGDNLLARYGGEEFFVAMPGATEKSLLDTAERIRLAVCSKPFDLHQGSPIDVSVSIGCFLAAEDFHGEMTRAVHYADDALYKAKESGRNRVVRYESRLEDDFSEDSGERDVPGE